MPTAKKKITNRATAGNGKNAAKNDKKGRAAGAKRGLMKPIQPDSELAAIVGDKPMPRTEVTKKVWDYIKSHNLQDEENRRMINADEKLRRLFGGKKRVSMFEMAKLVNEHVM